METSQSGKRGLQRILHTGNAIRANLGALSSRNAGRGATEVMRMPLIAAILLLAPCLGQVAAASSEDEAWIERFMSQPGEAATPKRVMRGYAISIAELPRFVGRQLKIRTAAGRTQRVVLDGIEEGRLQLRHRVHGGYATSTLPIDQVVSVELD